MRHLKSTDGLMESEQVGRTRVFRDHTRKDQRDGRVPVACTLVCL
jgi:hypothetical protein